VRKKEITLPMIYVQLIAQLIAEDEHGEEDEGHEARRRQSYARQVLDKAGVELRYSKVEGAVFRSAVLSPILQRNMKGVPDSYTPSVCNAISGGEVTIRDATEFYLWRDPVDPTYISHYRRNLLCIPPSRWYLAVLLGITHIGDAGHYNRVNRNHDKVMAALRESLSDSTQSDEDSNLSATEIEVIGDKGLQGFFEEEIDSAVCALFTLSLPPPHP
jgi:hypothetical protein